MEQDKGTQLSLFGDSLASKTSTTVALLRRAKFSDPQIISAVFYSRKQPYLGDETELLNFQCIWAEGLHEKEIWLIKLLKHLHIFRTIWYRYNWRIEIENVKLRYLVNKTVFCFAWAWAFKWKISSSCRESNPLPSNEGCSWMYLLWFELIIMIDYINTEREDRQWEMKTN